MRVPVGQHPEHSVNLPGQPYGAMYLGTATIDDVETNSWRGYCVMCGAVSANLLPLTPAWDEARDHHDRMHLRPAPDFLQRRTSLR